MAEANKTKEDGNGHFKAGRHEEALACYTKAIKLNPHGGAETAVYYKNRAACFLKLGKNEEVVADCTAGKFDCYRSKFYIVNKTLFNTYRFGKKM